MSAGLALKSDIARRGWHGRKVPIAAVSNRSKPTHYSITSSARARSVGGTSRPSVLAVSALMTLELRRLHDRQLRRLDTLEDTAGIDADLPMRICQARSVAHQPAGFDAFTRRIYRRDWRRPLKLLLKNHSIISVTRAI